MVPLFLQKALAFVVHPHMTYILVDGKPKASPMDDVIAFITTTDPFLHRFPVPSQECTVVVLFLVVNVDEVWFPKLFAVDVLRDDGGVAHVGKCRTAKEAEALARYAAKRLAEGSARTVPEGHLFA